MNAWVLVILTYMQSIEFRCLPPDPEDSSNCVTVLSCPYIKESTRLDPEAADFNKRLACFGKEGHEFIACCENSTLTKIKIIKSLPSVSPQVDGDVLLLQKKTIEARREYVKNNLLPSQKFCGQQHTDDYFYEGNETAIDEFPWIAHIADDFDVTTRACTGVLINNRYVLTSRNCGFEYSTVRLGQHSNQKNVTCVQESPLYLECTDPVVTTSVEKIIFGGNADTFYHRFNLMLLRLNKNVTFGEYIRPICLPIDGSKRPTSENYLTFSGFGTEKKYEVLKKRITYNLTSSQVCFDAAPDMEEYLKLNTASLACLVPPPGNTLYPCYGEQGGPLMYRYKYKWFADAIFIDIARARDAEEILLQLNSGNFTLCNATTPVAGAYITPTIMDWILDSIEA